MNYYTFAAESDDAGMRADVFITRELPELSRSGIKRLMDESLVELAGKPVKANFRLRAGDVLTVSVPEPVELEILPEDIPLDVIYEDNDVIVVNKPRGMVVHPAPGHSGGTLVNALMQRCGSSLSGINGVLRPGIVHRIDKDTSGVIMAAKNNAAHISLSEQLACHSITRKYYAVVFNRMKADEGVIDAPIARNPSDRKKMAVARSGGRRAVTHYRVLKHLGKYDYIEATLETGRTHQIRVHMAHIGHPLLGDMVYGARKQPFKLEGQALHAGVLGFKHPATGEYMEFRAEPPEYFDKLLKRLESMQQ